MAQVRLEFSEKVMTFLMSLWLEILKCGQVSTQTICLFGNQNYRATQFQGLQWISGYDCSCHDPIARTKDNVCNPQSYRKDSGM